MPNTIPVGKYYNFDNKNVDVVYNPAKDENKGGSGGGVYDVNLIGSDGNYSLDKTFAEVTAAVKAGMIVRVIKDNGFFSSKASNAKNDTRSFNQANAMFAHLTFADPHNFVFSCLNDATNVIVTFQSNDVVAISEVTFSES